VLTIIIITIVMTPLGSDVPLSGAFPHSASHPGADALIWRRRGVAGRSVGGRASRLPAASASDIKLLSRREWKTNDIRSSFTFSALSISFKIVFAEIRKNEGFNISCSVQHLVWGC